MKKVSTFGGRIREYLVNKGLFQKELVDMIAKKGVKLTSPQLTMYLQDKNLPREELISIMADTMGVSVVWLKGYDFSKQDEQMLDLFQSLDTENKSAVMDVIKAIVEKKNNFKNI